MPSFRLGREARVLGPPQGPLGGLFGQNPRLQPPDACSVREDSHHVGMALDLSVEALQRTARVQPRTTFARRIHVGQPIAPVLLHDERRPGQPGSHLTAANSLHWMLAGAVVQERRNGPPARVDCQLREVRPADFPRLRGGRGSRRGSGRPERREGGRRRPRRCDRFRYQITSRREEPNIPADVNKAPRQSVTTPAVTSYSPGHIPAYTCPS